MWLRAVRHNGPGKLGNKFTELALASICIYASGFQGPNTPPMGQALAPCPSRRVVPGSRPHPRWVTVSRVVPKPPVTTPAPPVVWGGGALALPPVVWGVAWSARRTPLGSVIECWAQQPKCCKRSSAIEALQSSAGFCMRVLGYGIEGLQWRLCKRFSAHKALEW